MLKKERSYIYMNDNITFIYPQGDNYITNLAFIKALFIKKYVESLNVSKQEKMNIWYDILEYFKNS